MSHESWPPLVRALDRWNAHEVLETPDSRTAFFEGLDFSGYSQLLLAVNGMALHYTKLRRFVPAETDMVQWNGGENTGTLDRKVSYIAVNGDDRMFMVNLVFQAAKQIKDPNAAVTMLGLTNFAIHPLHDGHTRTLAVSRQLLAPEGRGYRETDEDRRYYTNLVSDRSLYFEQSFHPSRGDLTGRYNRAVVKDFMATVGYDGPLPVALQTDTIRSVYELLPARWSHERRLHSAIILNERDFSLTGAMVYLRMLGENPFDFLVNDYSTLVLSIDKFVAAIPPHTEGEIFDNTLYQINRSQKWKYVEEMARCFVVGQSNYFGSAEELQRIYALPQPG